MLFTCVKNTHVNSFHCCVKSFCWAAFFTYVYMRFRPTNTLGPGLKTKRAGIWFEQQEKMAATVNKRLLPLFYLRQRRKRRQRYRKKYWIRDIFRSPFLLGEYHTLVKEMHENDRVITSILEWLLNDLLRLPIQWFAFYCSPWINFVEQELIYGLESTWYTEVTQASKNFFLIFNTIYKNSWVQKSKFWFGSITELNRTH